VPNYFLHTWQDLSTETSWKNHCQNRCSTYRQTPTEGYGSWTTGLQLISTRARGKTSTIFILKGGLALAARFLGLLAHPTQISLTFSSGGHLRYLVYGPPAGRKIQKNTAPHNKHSSMCGSQSWVAAGCAMKLEIVTLNSCCSC